MIKEFQFEANDDKKQIVNLEVELTTNVDTIEDLMRKITNSEQEINLLKYELSIQSQSNTKAHELMKTLHAREVGRLKFEIKTKSNEIRKLKISRAMRKSKKNAVIQNKIENDDDIDDAVMDNKEISRAVKSVMDILKLESKQSTKKRLTIIKKIAKKIECEKILDSTTEIENDVGQSIIKFTRILWKFVSNENIKKILNIFLLAAVTYSETSTNQIATAFGVHRQNSLLVAAFKKQNSFICEDSTLDDINMDIKAEKRDKRKDAMSDEQEQRASLLWEKNCEVSPNMKDVCRHRFKGGPWIEHIKHFQYDTEAELLK